MSFRETALRNRHTLIVAIAYLARQKGSTAANTAYEICQQAIQWGYTAPRTAPKGATMDMWVKRKEVPAWAAKAVSRMLLVDPDFQLQSQEQALALALTLAEALPEQSADELFNQIPTSLQKHLTLSLLNQACEAKKI